MNPSRLKKFNFYSVKLTNIGLFIFGGRTDTVTASYEGKKDNLHIFKCVSIGEIALFPLTQDKIWNHVSETEENPNSKLISIEVADAIGQLEIL